MVNVRTFLIVIALFACIFIPSAHAAVFDLSVVLTEGGYRLDLGPERTSRGVQLRVDSDADIRYEIVQRVVSPLENRESPGVFLGDRFVVRAVSGSNRFGSVRLASTDAPVRSEDVVYVSNPAGNADNCSFVYSIISFDDVVPGVYAGRISFTLYPIGSSQPAVTRVLEVQVTVSRSAAGVSGVGFITPSGGKTITLKPSDPATRAADVLVSLPAGVSGKPFMIKQALREPFVSSDGEALDKAVITASLSPVQKGSAGVHDTVVSLTPQTVYTSSPSGESDRSCILTYRAQAQEGLKAGIYRSRVQYLLEERGAQRLLDTFDIVLESERVFNLVVRPQDQKYTIEFRDLTPRQPVKRSEVILEIQSNIARRYQVVQEIQSDLVNAEGKQIPQRYFTFYAEGSSSKGSVRDRQPAEVKKGATVLFISDERGSPDTFKVTYELRFPEGVQAGDYGSTVTYSLAEL